MELWFVQPGNCVKRRFYTGSCPSTSISARRSVSFHTSVCLVDKHALLLSEIFLPNSLMNPQLTSEGSSKRATCILALKADTDPSSVC